MGNCFSILPKCIIPLVVLLKSKILDCLDYRRRMRPGKLQDLVGVSRTLLHKALNQLVAEGLVAKYGRVPRVYYHLTKIGDDLKKLSKNHTTEEFIMAKFLSEAPYKEPEFFLSDEEEEKLKAWGIQ